MLNRVKNFISKRKAKDQVLIEMYKNLHEPPRLKKKTLLLLGRYSASLSAIKKRLPTKNWKAIQNRFKAEAVVTQVITFES